jgi:hypothetical protein
MPECPDDLPEWADADRVSDQITDLARAEIERGTSPLQIFAGLMLALLGVMRSAPEGRPMMMELVEIAVSGCLQSMMKTKKREEN